MSKHSYGRYYRKLQTVFIIITLLVTLILSSVMGLFLIHISKKNDLNAISLARTVLEENAISSMDHISSTMTDIVSDPSIWEWADAYMEKDFYLRSVSVQKALKKYAAACSTRFWPYLLIPEAENDSDFSSASRVLSTEGSFSVSDFLKNTGLKAEDLNDIRDYFSEHLFPFVKPHYNQDGELQDLFYFIKGYQNTSDCIYMAWIPIQSLMTTAAPASYWITDSTSSLISSSSDQETQEKFHTLLDSLDPEQDINAFSSTYISRIRVPAMDWNIYCLYQQHSIRILHVVLFFLLILGMFLLLCMVFFSIARLLYRPIYQTLKPALMESTGMVDEFKLLDDNLNKLRSLNRSLLETQKKADILSVQQYYHALLTDPNGYLVRTDRAYFSDSEDFCVALLCFSSEADAFSDTVSFSQLENRKNSLLQSCIKRQDCTFVRLTLNTSALILKADTVEKAKELIADLMAGIPETGDLNDFREEQIILSPIGHGMECLYHCYQKALKVAEYLPRLPHEKLITYDQIASLDSSTYSYPLTTETRLIHRITGGQENALELFDEIIRENLVRRILPMEVLQNFIYSLIGTVIRVFQELKTTPEELLGHSLDYAHWYSHWADAVTITAIKHTLEEILVARTTLSKTEDELLLSRMLDYIHQNFQQNIMLNDLAEQFNISSKYCGILFKQLSENNFKDYLNRYRIEQSKKFIAENPALKTKDLSIMTGFNSSNTFIRVFGKYTGMTPQKYAETVMQNRETP